MRPLKSLIFLHRYGLYGKWHSSIDLDICQVHITNGKEKYIEKSMPETTTSSIHIGKISSNWCNAGRRMKWKQQKYFKYLWPKKQQHTHDCRRTKLQGNFIYINFLLLLCSQKKHANVESFWFSREFVWNVCDENEPPWRNRWKSKGANWLSEFELKVYTKWDENSNGL